MAGSTPPKGLPSDKRVMVVDDDESVLQLLKATFEVEGFQVRVARDGRNLAQKASEYKPDLIVTDLMMPGGGGYEVLRSLQADDVTRKTPVIMITGHVLDDSTKTMIKQEPNLAALLEKPVRPEKLTKEVHRVLNTMTRDEQNQQFKDMDYKGFGGPV